MARNEKIVFQFEGDTRDLERALRGLEKSTDRAAGSAASFGVVSEKSMRGAAKGALAVAAAAAAAAAAIALGVKKVIDFGNAADKVAKAARAVGASAEEYQEVVGGFELLGLSAEQTEAAVKKLGLRIGQVAAGAGGPAADAFARLGLTAKELEALPLPERMALLADRIGGLKTQSEQAAIANAIFEESGLAMVGAFAAGGDAVRDASEKVREAGIVSNESAAEAERMADAVSLVKRAWSGMLNEVMEPFVPVIADIASLLSDVIMDLTRTGEIRKFGTTLVDVFLRFVAPAAAYMAEVVANSVAAIKPAILSVTIGMMRLKTAFLAIGFQGEEAAKMISKIQAAEQEWRDAVRDLGAVQETASQSRKDFIEGLKEIQENLGKTTTIADGAADAVAEYGAAISTTVTAGDAGDEFKKSLEQTRDLVTGITSGIQGLFAQIGANIAASLNEAEAELDSLNERIDRSSNAQLKKTLARQRDALEEKIENQKKGAVAAFVIGKAAALSQAAVATALAVIASFAEGGPALAAAAGVAGALSVATIAAEPPPSFHAGGMVGLGAPDEISARLLRSEAVLNPQGVRAAGGADGVRDLNRGSPGGAQPVVTVFKVRSRTVDAMVSDNLRTRQGPLVDALRAAQPRALGRHNPYSGA